MKLIIVRHGKTEENAKEIIQGHRNGTISREGKEQIKKLALRLKNEKIDVIFSSDLQRCKDTVKEIAGYHKAPAHYVKDLRERDPGVFEGRPSAEFKKERERLGKTREEFKPSGGENLHDVSKRAGKFLQKLREKYYSDKTVLIVSHGGFNKILLGILLEKPIKETAELEQRNTCVNMIEIRDDGKPKLHLLNCIKHLE